MFKIFCAIILTLIGIQSIHSYCITTTQIPVVGAVLTSSASWIKIIGNVGGCYNPKNMGFQVFSNNKIDSTLPDF